MQHTLTQGDKVITNNDLMSLNYSISIYSKNRDLSEGVLAQGTLTLQTTENMSGTYVYAVDGVVVGNFTCKQWSTSKAAGGVMTVTLYDTVGCLTDTQRKNAIHAGYFGHSGAGSSIVYGTYASTSKSISNNVADYDINRYESGWGGTISMYALKDNNNTTISLGDYVQFDSSLYMYVQSISWDLYGYTIGSTADSPENTESQIEQVVTQMAGYNQRFENNEQRIGIVITDQNEVNRAAIVASINEDGQSQALIKADKINLQGAVTFDSMSSGTKGNIITSTVVEYALGTSETTAPTSGWSTTAPAHEAGKYMWQRTTVTKADGSSPPQSLTCIQGADGEQGETGPTGPQGPQGPAGQNGQDGDDGISINWRGSFPSAPSYPSYNDAYRNTTDGKCYIYTYTWNEMVRDGAQGQQGPQGQTGADGATIQSTKMQYAVNTDPSSIPTSGWSDTQPETLADNQVCWTRMFYTLTNGATGNSNPVVDRSITDMVKWAIVDNKTYINGAYIATGTIEARSIAANTITADKIDTTNLTVKKLEAEANSITDYVAVNVFEKINGTVNSTSTVRQYGMAVNGSHQIPRVNGTVLGTYSGTTMLGPGLLEIEGPGKSVATTAARISTQGVVLPIAIKNSVPSTVPENGTIIFVVVG